MSIAITSPASGATLQPGDSLVFVINPDAGLPASLEAVVTLTDGSTETAWDFDQPGPGYSGSLNTDGGIRTYTVSRIAGWPLGPLSMSVTTPGGGETLLYDSGTLTPEHEVNNPSVDYVLNGIPFNTFGTGPLKMAVTADIQKVGFGVWPTSLIVADPGFAYCDIATGIGSAQAPATAPTGTYASYVYNDQTSGDPFSLFTGPGVAKSLYFHTPYSFFLGGSGDFKFKNIRVLVYSEGGGDETAMRSWNVGPILPVEGAPDLVAQALGRVIIQYRESQKILQFIRVIVSPLQELANVAVQMQQLDDPDVATGVNLDVLGEIVGQLRLLDDGQTPDDPEYRVLQTARRARNAARGTPEDLLSLLSNLLGARIVLIDHGGMAFSYTIMRSPTADEVAVLGDLLPRPMGVKVTRSWAPAVYYGYSTDPGASGYGVGHYVEAF